jgi:hypothetical protein
VHLHAPERQLLEDVDLPARVHDGLDVELLQRLDVLFVEKALEQQDALFPARVASPLGVAEVDGRQSVGVGERLDGVFEAVAVSVGLHDGPERAGAGIAANARKVVLHRRDINFSKYRTGHFFCSV